MEYPNVIGLLLERPDAIRITLDRISSELGMDLPNDCDNATSICQYLGDSGVHLPYIPYMGDAEKQFQRTSANFPEVQDLRNKVKRLEKSLQEKAKE